MPRRNTNVRSADATAQLRHDLEAEIARHANLADHYRAAQRNLKQNDPVLLARSLESLRTADRPRRIVAPDCMIGVEIEAEDQDPRDCFAGDPAEDAALIEDIRLRLRDGDTWAWCYVRVTVICGPLRADNTIGGCCYADEAAFRRDGYFTSMVDECLEDLNQQLDGLLGKLRAR